MNERPTSTDSDGVWQARTSEAEAAAAEPGDGAHGVALTIGAFDGVHRGHQDLISRMVEDAQQEGLGAVCVTFEPDPEVVLHPEREHRGLSTAEERQERIGALGVTAVDVVPFTPGVASQTPVEFVNWVRSRYAVQALWVGPDFALGRDRSGGVPTLREIGARDGFRVVAIEPLQHNGRPISSTWIRDALASGDVELAAQLLGRPYCIAGTVVPGMRRGRELGFPTANVVPPRGRALPADGVYLVRADMKRGQTPLPAPRSLFGVVNLGGRPTFDEADRLLEAHLLDFEGDLYGSYLEACFLHQIRGIQRFSGIDELRAAIERDVALARELARSIPGSA